MVSSILELSSPLMDSGVGETATEVPENDSALDDFSADDDSSLRLKFRERPLRDFFRAANGEIDPDDIRTSPSQAHLDLLSAAVDLICSSRHSLDGQLSAGLDYAASFWHKHLLRIDIASASPETTARVLGSVNKILENHVSAAKVFEQHFRGEESFYDAFAGEVIPVIMAWRNRADGITSGNSTLPTDNWVSKVGTDPNQALDRLARGHAFNWFRQVSLDLATVSAETAQQALVHVGILSWDLLIYLHTDCR